MGRSCIFIKQDLHSHVDRMTSHVEWSTNTELNMIGALALINVNSIEATDVEPNNWNIHPVYVHEHYEVPLECDHIYEVQKLGLFTTGLSIKSVLSTFTHFTSTPYFYYESVNQYLQSFLRLCGGYLKHAPVSF